MKIAITVWNGRVAPLFDVASTVRFVTVQGGRPGEQVEMTLAPGTGMIRRVAFLLEKGTDVLICGAVSSGVHRMLTASGIGVHPFVSGDGKRYLKHSSAETLRTAFSGCPDAGVRDSWVGEVPADTGKEVRNARRRRIRTLRNGTQRRVLCRSRAQAGSGVSV